MKVRCTKLTDSRDKPQDRSRWLTLGKLYNVLEVVLDGPNRWLLRLAGDGEDAVGLFQLDQFEIVSAKIPSTWIARWNDRGGFLLTTETWSQLGYWDRYYDRDPEARKAFEDERTRIVQEDP
jgi:hypothetical protein